MKTEEKRPSEDGTQTQKHYTTFRPYSMSRLLEYERCPRRFAFKYVQHLPEIQDNAGFVGAKIHEAIAKALRNEDWEDTLLELNYDDIEEGKIKVLTALKRSRDLEGAIVGIETKFSITENGNLTDFGASDSWLRGIIDLLIQREDGTFEVWDWKTGHSTPTKFQVFLYAWAIQRTLNVKVSRVGYILLSSKDVLSFDVNDEELEITSKKLYKLVRNLENEEKFMATPGGHCAYCSYVSMCPLASAVEAKDIPAIREDTEAREVSQQIEVLEQKLKKYQAALKVYVDSKDSGKIDLGNGHFYGLSYSETISKKRGQNDKELSKAVWDFLQANGEDPMDYFTFEAKAIEPFRDTHFFDEHFSESKRKNYGYWEAEK